MTISNSEKVMARLKHLYMVLVGMQNETILGGNILAVSCKTKHTLIL